MSILDPIERFGNSLNKTFIEGGKNTLTDLNKLGNVINKGAGYAVQPKHWIPMAEGTVKGVVKGQELTAKAAAYTVNPTHWDDIAKAGYHGTVSTWHGLENMGGGIEYAASHPKLWYPMAKHFAKEQITNPVNLATNVGFAAATIASGGATAPAWMARLGLGAAEGAESGAGLVKIAQTADELSAASKAVEALKPIDEGVQATTRLGRYGQSLSNISQSVSDAKGLGKVGAAMDAPTAAIRATRSDLLGMNELSTVQRARNAVADFVNPSVNAEGVSSRWYEKYAYRKIAGGAGLADEGAQTTGSNLQTRIGQFQEGLASPRQLRNKIQVYTNVAGAIADPKQAASRLGHAAWNQWGDEAMKVAWDHKSQIMDKLRGGGKTSEAEKPFEPLTEPTQSISMQQYRLDRTQATRTSQRRPNQMAQLGTVTTNTTMPTQIGPSDWYGPQNNYTAGRGFSGSLPPLEQPSSNVPQSISSQQTLGV
jgi:hypothetical protein